MEPSNGGEQNPRSELLMFGGEMRNVKTVANESERAEVQPIDLTGTSALTGLD